MIVPEKEQRVKITQALFGKLLKVIIGKCINVVRKVVTDSKQSVDRLHQLLFVGETCQIPQIRTVIEAELKKVGNSTLVSPTEIVRGDEKLCLPPASFILTPSF